VTFRRQALWSAAGALLPAIAALVTVPGLTRALGPSGFGTLAVAWALLGWFSLADLGLSRAVTQVVAQAIARGEEHEGAALTWSAMACMLVASVAVAIPLWWAAPWLATLLRVPVSEWPGTVSGLRWMAAALPPTVGMLAWRGVLEGCQAFRESALLRAPFGVAFALVPWWLGTSGYGLAGAIQGMAAVRLVGWVAHLVVARRVFPALVPLRWAPWSALRGVLAFGGWTTLSNVASPLMNTVDRVGIGALVTAAALAPYAAATEVATKIWLLTAILVPVYYPHFAGALVQAPARAVARLVEGGRLLVALGVPGLVILSALATPGLGWWLGDPLAATAARCLQWLTIGLAPNLLAQLQLALVQAAGRPAYAAWGHLLELPLFVGGLAWAVPRYGAEGAAAVWSARMMLDALWLLVMTERAVTVVRTQRRTLAGLLVGSTGLLALVGVAARTMSPLAALMLGLGAWALWLSGSGVWRQWGPR
jgi:O-antigen/teichoic acid export membrane protein